MIKADENKTMFTDSEDNKIAYNDKAIFVRNLGWLLSQTRSGIVGCALKDYDTATVIYPTGLYKYINIHLDSYDAIIRDVLEHM